MRSKIVLLVTICVAVLLQTPRSDAVLHGKYVIGDSTELQRRELQNERKSHKENTFQDSREKAMERFENFIRLTRKGKFTLSLFC